MKVSKRQLRRIIKEEKAKLLEARVSRAQLEMPWMEELGNMIVNEIYNLDDDGDPLDMEDPKNKKRLYQVLESIMYEYDLE